MSFNKKGLGKGLGALIVNEEKIESIEENNGIIDIDINKIEPNENQPRKNFNQKLLEELAESIKEFGIIQPIIVKKENDFYTIIAGERRYRAARMLKLKTVPAIVKDYDEMEMLQIALIENIQREDLNPIEEALCYQKLTEYFFFKKEDIAKKVGKSRNTIGSIMSLLNLDQRVQKIVEEGGILIGQAKKLLEIKDNELQFELANKIKDNELSIKETEELIAAYLKAKQKDDNFVEVSEINRSINNYNNIENILKDILGTKVNIKNGNKKGKIEIEYYSEEELDRLICMFKNIEMGG